MLAFGLGTLPVMLPLTWAGARLGQRLQRGSWRMAFASVLMICGVLTVAAPWLLHVPVMRGVLLALGCQVA